MEPIFYILLAALIATERCVNAAVQMHIVCDKATCFERLETALVFLFLAVVSWVTFTLMLLSL